MNILLWLMTGAVIGVITSIVSPLKNRGGIIGATMLGIIGTILGGFTANALINTSLFTFDVQAFAFAILGGMSLLAIGKLFSADISRFHKYER